MSRPSAVGAALAAAGEFLLEPAEPRLSPAAREAPPKRPVIAVFGLAPGCGTTVVARALALELAGRDPAGVAVVACEAGVSGVPLASAAASHLAGALVDLPGATARAVGRLCLIAGADAPAVVEGARGLAPLVLDAGSRALGGVPACLADSTVIVTSPAIEPALARVAAECLARVGPEPVLAVNRARRMGADAHLEEPPGPPGEPPGPPGEPPGSGSLLDGGLRGPLSLPGSRLGAQLAASGREVRGELGRAIAELADRCEAIA